MKPLFLAIALAASLATCSEQRRPDPRPFPPAGAAGAAGAPLAGAGGAAGNPGPAGAAGAYAGGHGGYAPGGSGGAPAGGRPLCVPLPSTWPQPDLEVEATARDLAAGLAKTGAGGAAGWLVVRDFTGAAVVTLPPVGAEPPWDAARLGLVLAWMPGGGHVEAAQPGCATCGVRSPCPGVPERQTAIVRGATYPSAKSAPARRLGLPSRGPDLHRPPPASEPALSA